MKLEKKKQMTRINQVEEDDDTGKQNIPPNLPTATELGNNKGICN